LKIRNAYATHIAGRSCLFGAILLALTGCGGDVGVRPPSAGATGAVSSGPPRVTFRLAPDDMPTEGRWKSVPIVTDINGDGFVDLIVHPRLGTGARVWLGDGKGGWKDSSKGLEMNTSCGGGLAVGDVNGDGKLDLVVADHCSGIYVYLGDGKGGWQAVVEGLTPERSRGQMKDGPDPNAMKGAESVALADVNGDGFLDLVVPSSDQGGYTVYLGDGTGNNWKELKGSGLPNAEEPEPGDTFFAGFAFDSKLVDMNGDGQLDLVSSYYNGPRVWWGDGKGHFTNHSTGLTRTRVGGTYWRIAIGDINKDGRPDLVVANLVNGAEVYLQNADGSWQGPTDAMPELKGGARAVALCDLDGDGNLDLVIGGRKSATKGNEQDPANFHDPHGVFVRFGDGKGGWVEGPPGMKLPEIGVEVIWGIACVDVNGDGRPDIVVTTGGDIGKPSPTIGAASPGRPGGRAPGTADPDSGPQTTGEFPRIQIWMNEGPGRR
jgi:hypothetical protein